jgi:hypothetical protein
MQRNRNAEESDEDDGFKVTNSGRIKGFLPRFMPAVARDRRIVDALYHCNHKPPPGTEQDLSDDHPWVVRKRVLKELVMTELKPPPETHLPPLPQALHQRRRNEANMAAAMELRLANSSPQLSKAVREVKVRRAREASHRRLAVSGAVKGWRKDHFGAAVDRSGCASCPPTLGLKDGDNLMPVALQYERTPWQDPAVMARAAQLELAEARAEKQRRNTEGPRDAEGRSAALKAAKDAYPIPLNEATVAAPLHPVYDYRKQNKQAHRR